MNPFRSFTEHEVQAHNQRVARGKARSEPMAPIQETFALDATRPSYKLILPFPPSENHYRGCRIIIPKDKNQKPFVMWYLTAKAKEFKARAEQVARGARMPVLRGNLLVVIHYFFQTNAGDMKNRDKVLLDVLQGIAYENDKQITRSEEERFKDPANPRVEVVLQERI